MNLFYANGTPVINSLKIQSEVPLDPRLNPETIEERDSLVTKHIAYDRMKVYVKETDSEYVYHKDKNEWVILSKFEKEEKDKLENIKNYLVDTEIIYDKDNNLLYREHSYDPNTNITSLRDYSIPEATVLGDGTLYNGLLSKFYVNRLNNVTGYQTDAKITSDTETESLFLTVTKYNPDTDESVTTNLNIPLVTDDNNGLVSPEKKHWMDNADGLSNTGTTSQTWQLQKSDIDTRLDPNGGVIIKNSGGKLEVRDNQDNSYAPVTLGDIIIEGNVTQKGESFITQAETVEVRDNTILLNRGETAAGVSKGFAGIEIDRGTLPKFQILFDESDRRFKAGEEGDLWCLALRDDDADMLNGMFTSWDSATKRLKTTNIIPSDRKLAFTDNNSYLQLTSHSFSGDALSQTLRYSNSLGGIFISAGNTNLNLDTDKTSFYFHKNILLPSTISSVSDFLFKRSDVTKLSLKDTVAQFTVPVTAITFNRASDGSEVLYHADLENTEFKNYITIAGPNDIKLYLKSTDEDNYNLISSVDQDGNKLSNMGYYGSYWAIENNRIAVYKYDANGYPEIINQDGTSPGYLRACTSGFLPNVSGNLASGGNGYLGTSSWAFANAYIANNHSNKYYFGTNDVFLDASTTRISARTSGAAIGMNVGSLLVSNDYSDETKVPDNGTYSKGAIKSYTGFTSDFRISNLTITKTGSDVLHISSFASDPENMPGTDPISSQVINDGVALTYFWQGDYAFQLVGDIDGTGMAYRMYHPSTGTSTSWKFLADTNWVSNKITSVAGNYLPLAGGTMTGNIIMSNNIIIQSKDSSGNSKRLIGKGSDNVTYIGDSDGHTFLYSDAADISHIRNGTSYRIWDSYNLTNPVTYTTDTYNYATLRNKDGQYFTYIKAGTNGLLPHSKATLVSGGSGSLGTSDQSFNAAYINNLHTNKVTFGDAGSFIDNQSGDSSHKGIGFYTSQNATCPVYVGSLCVSDGYANSAPNIPTNGIYSKGIIYIENGIGFRNSIWTNDLTPNRNYSGYLQVLDAYNAAEAGGPTNYGTVLQINSKTSHWANQLWFPGGAEASKNGLYYRHMAYNQTEYGEWNRLLTNKDVNIIQTQSSSNPSTLPANQIFYSEIKNVAETPTDQGALFSVQGDDEGIQLWASSSKTKLYYRTKWTSFGNWIKLVTEFDLNSYLTKTEASTLYYPYNGRGYLSITSTGKPVMSNNQGYAVKDKDGNEREVLWMGPNNALYLGNTSQYTLGQLDLRCTTLTHNGSSIATQNYVTNQLSNYLPLTGGTLTGQTTISTSNTSVPLIINYAASGATDCFIRFNLNGTASGAVGFLSSKGTYLYNYSNSKYLFLKNDGVYFGTSSSDAKLLTSADLSSYATQSWVNSQGFLKSADMSGYATQSWVTSQGYYKSGSSYPLFTSGVYLAANAGTTGGWAREYWVGNSSSTGATGVGFGGYGNGDTPNYAYIGVGANLSYSSVNNLKVYTDKVTFGNKTLATVDQIPTIPSISITTSGSGSVVTGISASGHTLTVTKGSASVSVSWDDITGKPSSFTPSAHTHEYIVGRYTGSGGVIAPGSIGTNKLQCNMMYTNAESSGGGYCDWILMNAYSWSDVPYATAIGVQKSATPSAYIMSGPNSTDKSTWVRKKLATTDEIPTRTSDLINNSGFITSSSLSGYATQSWVTNQNYAVQASGNNLIVNENEFNFANSNTTTVYINYRSGVGGNTSSPISSYKFYNGQGLPAGVRVIAETFVGALDGNATTATTASKLGSSTVGGTAKPIYLSAGTATACSATVGSSTVPVYMNAGTITQCSTTLGVSITGNAATATTSTKWNGYDIWVGTESQLPSSRSSTTIYIVTDA